jgi:hypothetical protein
MNDFPIREVRLESSRGFRGHTVRVFNHLSMGHVLSFKPKRALRGRGHLDDFQRRRWGRRQPNFRYRHHQRLAFFGQARVNQIVES